MARGSRAGYRQADAVAGLDADVAAALARAGLRAREVRNVTTIEFPAFRRATYRIDLESGGTIKARCLEDAAAATRLFDARRHVPRAFVPAVLCAGRVVLEEWVTGVPVETPPDRARLAEAAGLLAELHATAPHQGDASRADSTASWRAEGETGLRTLVASGAMKQAQCDTLADQLRRSDPGRGDIVLGHFDFCGENMLVDDRNHLRVFDNERVGYGPLGFDLARTWYRWDLSNHAWTSFVDAYADASGRPNAVQAFDFWRIVVLVNSACLRLDRDRMVLAVPIDKLTALAGRIAAAPR